MSSPNVWTTKLLGASITQTELAPVAVPLSTWEKTQGGCLTQIFLWNHSSASNLDDHVDPSQPAARRKFSCSLSPCWENQYYHPTHYRRFAPNSPSPLLQSGRPPPCSTSLPTFLEVYVSPTQLFAVSPPHDEKHPPGAHVPPLRPFAASLPADVGSSPRATPLAYVDLCPLGISASPATVASLLVYGATPPLLLASYVLRDFSACGRAALQNRHLPGEVFAELPEALVISTST